MINHPNRSNPILAFVRAILGRRYTISRRELRDLLDALDSRRLIELANDWQPRIRGAARRTMLDTRTDAELPPDLPSGWAQSVRSITVISVLSERDPRYGSNPGSIRYDAPGSMHPHLRATLMFVSATAAERRETLEYLRDRAARVFIVTDDEASPAETGEE